MELTDLRAALRQYWYVAVIGLAFWLVVGGTMAFVPEPRYETSATLAAAPRDAAGIIEITAYELPVIVAELGTSQFERSVANNLPGPAAEADVSLSADNPAGEPLVYITANAADPEVAAQWATAAARRAVAVRSDAILPLRLIDEAEAPSAPVSPRTKPILLASTVVGLLTAVLASVVAFRLRKALSVEEDIERRLGLPVIGRLPVERAVRVGGRESANVLVSTPELAEAFAGLRTSLEIALSGAKSSVVAVASWGEGEGKSTIAAGIALTTAAFGHDVVAVDADLRHPELHERLGQPFGEGVAELARRDVDRIIGPTDHRHLWFVPAGIPDRHPADVLSVNLPTVIRAAVANGRRVIIDCPPIDGLAETFVVLAAAGNVVLVVDARRARLIELETTVAQLRAADVNILGVVLNRTKRSRRSSTYAAYSGGTTPMPRPPENGRLPRLPSAPPPVAQKGRRVG